MKWRWTMHTEYGFPSMRYFDSEEEAKEACEKINALSSQQWVVVQMLCGPAA